MPGVAVVRSAPDMKTMAKDLARAGLTLADDRGRRLDFHALRHTFSTNLDLAGCSRATKKKLMRHAPDDVTDGYTHAELSEMAAVLRRLPSPEAAVSQPAVMTGTDATDVSAHQDRDNQAAHQGRGRRRAAHQGARQTMVLGGQSTAVNGTTASEQGTGEMTPCPGLQPGYNSGVGTDGHSPATTDGDSDNKSFAGSNLRPSTQVD